MITLRQEEPLRAAMLGEIRPPLLLGEEGQVGGRRGQFTSETRRTASAAIAAEVF